MQLQLSCHQNRVQAMLTRSDRHALSPSLLLAPLLAPLPALAGNHLESVPAGLQHLQHLAHLGLALNYYKAWAHAAHGFASLSHTLQVSGGPCSMHCRSSHSLSCSPALLSTALGGNCHSRCAWVGIRFSTHQLCRHACICIVLCVALAGYLQELELQHTVTVLDDAAGFLAAIGQLTALTSLAAGSNQLNDLPQEWQQLKRLKVGLHFLHVSWGGISKRAYLALPCEWLGI
jgi:hypothetical protein